MRSAGVDCVWPLEAQLGEGPVWSAAEQVLRFVDIKAGQVHCYDPAANQGSSIPTDGMPSFIVPTEAGDWLVGSVGALHLLKPDGLGPALVGLDQPSHNRTNDAVVDRSGRLWFGTMDDHEQRETGRFWCLDKTGLYSSDFTAIVTNGPAICPINNRIYLVDSARRRIWHAPLEDAFDVKQRKLFVELGETEGFPDGVVVDSQGCLWVALWDGWAVRRYSPDGVLMQHVPMPCARVTKIAFGGADLQTAYVTTARTGLNQTALAEQPLAGGLFAFESEVSGNPTPAVANEVIAFLTA